VKQEAAEQDLVPIRFIGLDVHKQYAVAAGVDERQHIILNPRRITLKELGTWAAKTLQLTDVVVLEAMWNTWELYDQLTPLVAAVVVANPARTSRMKEPGVKTDAGDAVFLARLLASGMLPTVWVPPVATRELRALVSHRQRLVAQRTRARNRLHSVLLRHGIELPPGVPFSRRSATGGTICRFPQPSGCRSITTWCCSMGSRPSSPKRRPSSSASASRNPGATRWCSSCNYPGSRC
jgi:hypothetical protein